jgi:diguanylate cyclase (GGDEF)-like protein
LLERPGQSFIDPPTRWLRGALQCCLLLWLLLMLLPAQAARHTVAGWGMQQGLPHNLVQSVAQGSDGFIWVGTWEGAVRFNSRGFTVFDRQNTPGVELSGIESILAEADGAMLFGTVSDGIYRYHRGNWQALGGPESRHLPVIAMLRDQAGVLWVASGERLLRQLPTGQLLDVGATLGLPNAAITALRSDRDGALLVAGLQGVYRVHKGRLQPWAATAGQSVRDLVNDGDGGWIIATDDGIQWWHAGGRQQHLYPGERVDAVRRDARGALWLSFSDGRLERYAEGVGERIAIPGRVSPALMIDREGLVWAGSTDGLFRVDEGAARGLTIEDGLGSNYARAVIQSEDGTVWVGHSAGLDRLVGDRLVTTRLKSGNGPDASVLALATTPGSVWAGTYNQGVFRLDGNGEVQQQVLLPGSRQPLVRALLADGDRTLWVGGDDGLFRLRDGDVQHYGTDDGLPGAMVHSLYRDPAGQLWIGTNGGMASMESNGRLQSWRPGRDFPARGVFDFLGDENGDLWIATDHGLLRKRGLDFTVFDHRNGLPRDKLFRIIDDGNGNLWVSSNQGVFRLQRTDLVSVAAGARSHLSVEVIDHNDGMPSSQGNGASSPAGWLTQEGLLWFPTAGGLALIDPDRADGNVHQRKAPLAIESVEIDGSPQPMRAVYALPAEVERIAVAYAGLGFRAPDKMRYRYRMEGFDADWVDAGSRTEAVYTNLPPGSYRMRVQAMALPLDWDNRQRVGEAGITLDIAAPYWQRLWVQLLAAGLLVAGVLLLMTWHTASYRRRQRQLNTEISVRTQELSEKNRALEQAGAERDSLLTRLEYMAMHDALTGLPNRRAGDEHLQQALRQALEQGTSLCVALVDIDHFKQVNDRYGHEAGDQVLRDVAGLLRLQLGSRQFVSRHGGEEFLVVLRGLQLEEAVPLLQGLRIRLGRLRIDEVDPDVVITASIGLAAVKPGQDTVRTLLAAADHQLYRAKREGRNRLAF